MIWTILFPFSMIIGPFLMKSVNDYNFNKLLKFQTYELFNYFRFTCIIKSKQKTRSQMKLFVNKNDEYIQLTTKTNLKYLTHITQGKKKSKWFKVTNSRISRGMFIKNQKGREHYDSSFGLESLDDASCTSSVLRFRTISANSSSSSSFPSLYDKWGDILYPRDLQACIFPVAARSRPRYGGEGFIGRDMYSGWYCTPTKY